MDYPPAFTVVVQWWPTPIIRLYRCLLLNVEAKTIVDISQSVKVDPMLQPEGEHEPAVQQAQPQPTLPQLQHLLQRADAKAVVEEVDEETEDWWEWIYFRLPDLGAR